MEPQSIVYRVPGFLSSRPNWLSPPSHPQASVAPPPPRFQGVYQGWANLDQAHEDLDRNIFRDLSPTPKP